MAEGKGIEPLLVLPKPLVSNQVPYQSVNLPKKNLKKEQLKNWSSHGELNPNLLVDSQV